MPERIQLRRTPGWRKPANAVSVARPSRWGNPFHAYNGSVYSVSWDLVRANWGLGVWTWWDAVYTTHSSHEAAVEHSVDLFRSLCRVSARDYPDRFEKWIAPLRGRDLGCWCSLPQPGEPDICHASALLAVAAGETP